MEGKRFHFSHHKTPHFQEFFENSTISIQVSQSRTFILAIPNLGIFLHEFQKKRRFSTNEREIYTVYLENELLCGFKTVGQASVKNE